MSWKRLLIGVLAVALFSAPAQAGTFGLYGGFWDTDEADSSWGGGVRMGFDFFKWMELEFHGTYFPDFGGDVLGTNLEITALPVDGGLKFTFLPESAVGIYVGAGASYYFMDSDELEIDDQTGYYAEAGLDFGNKNFKVFVEAMWRAMETDIASGSTSDEASFDGITGNVGINWSWGK